MNQARGFWQKQQGLLAFWHAYRIPLIILFLVITLKIRMQLRSRYAQKKVPTLLDTDAISPSTEKPRIPTPEIESLSGERKTTDISSLRPQQDFHDNGKAKREPKRVVGSRSARKTAAAPGPTSKGSVSVIQPVVFFSSLTGTTESFAKSLVASFKRQPLGPSVLEPQLHDLSYIEYDDYFLSTPKKASTESDIKYFYLILVPSYNIDTVLNTFILHLQDTHYDFRVDTAPMVGLLGYAVFGFGDKEGWPSEEEGFCAQAREVDRWMAKLTDRKRAFPLGLGDVKSDAEKRLEGWWEGVRETLQMMVETGSLGEGVPGSGDALESDEDVDDEGILPATERADGSRKKRRRADREYSNDLEDIGVNSLEPPLAIDFTTSKSNATVFQIPSAPKPMVPTTSPTYAALTKQGYSIIGSHSGVKICRWTKSALRGRGSCYKHSFYGIASHLCMETTPSLSCSNKCVFCWRHGTNPVGTTWRWQVDPPDLIFHGAKEQHLKKIKMMRGVPGVRAERFQEAQRIRHCALSLVGEPIFYPHINELLALLHAERISSFLVCNAQHPDQLAALKHVTQLYVSIDASNRDSLRAIDRPLHRDFWERFLRCLDILRARRHTTRTVFRLTLVKGFNVDAEVAGYADLVARGLPCFVEIKGVTFCGTSTSKGAGLTMANVPFYEEVCEFVLALHAELRRRGLGYGIAAEHKHSCCALLASERFRIGGEWRTLIDYGRYFELLEAGAEFGPEDYAGAKTPEWALWGRGGFDPRDLRVDRKGRRIEGGGEVGSGAWGKGGGGER